MLLILVFLAIPLQLNPGKSGTMLLINGKDMQMSNKMNFFVSLGLLGGSLAISIVYPHIISVLGFIGGFLVCTFGIFFPGIIFYIIKICLK